ncbi:hypothetical protein SteCoe_28896 [Stentor coeruleus]|uniref:Uncharacterized protein n=1 Tax=Stentor coeruleus TaxID=5963 RepID=A0A1R2B7N1_9CILI|nr:hypothetical protein SteCoe_28896 [Stentor coeruleus]
MDIQYSGPKSIELDALFSYARSALILFIIFYTATDSCEEPLREWLLIEATVLMFRVGIIASFSVYSQTMCYKLIIMIIKVFSFIWVLFGIYWTSDENQCENSWTYYAVIGLILIFLSGIFIFIVALAVACYFVRANKSENNEMSQRLNNS